MRWIVLLVLYCLTSTHAAHAQVRSVDVSAPRAFGYFVGDLVRSQVDIVVDQGFAIQASSLPRPGPVAHWLELRSVDVKEYPRGADTLIRLDLTYQSFYAALDARSLEIPGFTVTLVNEAKGGTTSAAAQVPHWSIGVSPLQEVKPPARDDPADYLRPDPHVAPLDAAPSLRGAGILAGLAALALGWLAYDRAWWFFAKRGARAFAAAHRRIRGMRDQGDEAYRAALLALHRGLDDTDGRRVLADDLEGFLDRHPNYRSLAPALGSFFSASRLVFFGSDARAARLAWPFAETEKTAGALAAIERTV